MKTIKISDGCGHMYETLTLDASGLHGTDWVAALLTRNGCEVDEDMDAEDIESEVYDAWTGAGYDGDPVANGLVVTVSE